MIARWLLWVGFLLMTTAHAVAAEDTTKFAEEVKLLCHRYAVEFGSDRTQLVYHHRLDGPLGDRSLSSPAEIAMETVNGKPMPYGYGSGIQDVALENGQFLFALCEVFDATHDAEIGGLAQRIFRGMRRVATVSSEPGFAPRGPHPDGKSYYRDSSRDQHAALAEALWRYGRCDLATVDDRQFIAGELSEMARRMEDNDWKILVEDGSRIAHVGFGWRQSTPIGAISLLSFLAMVVDASGDPHYQDLYLRYSAEENAHRWKQLLDPTRVDDWKPFTLYSNQFAQAVLALQRIEADPHRKQQLSELNRRLAQRALHSNVLAPEYWRRLDWAGGEADRLAEKRLDLLGLSPMSPHNVVELLAAFDPAWMWSTDRSLRSTANKLCFGIPTAAFHMALASEDAELIAEVVPHVRRLVRVMLAHGRAYDRGENYNRTVVLALLLWAAEVRNDSQRPTYLQSCKMERLGLGPAMDVDYRQGLLYVIGEGKLKVVDVSRPESPILKGTIGQLGRVRQLQVNHNIAYVTAREDGLFLVDVSAPEKMRILAHYDTIELATGIEVSGDVAFVACRTAGVELIDVSAPESPRHLSTVRTGEAQSIRVRDGVLYVGVWGSGELVIGDVSDPYHPRVLARVQLEGYGDGVDVHGDYCYVATGHHIRRLPHRKPQDPGFGRGHGLEIFNVSDTSHPRFVGRVKFPPFYRLGMDMWDVKVTDRYAFVADTYNGVFVVDVIEPSQPRIVARRRLPFIHDRNNPSPAAGLTLGDNTVFVAGAWSDVHSFSWDTSSSHQERKDDVPPNLSPPTNSIPDPRFRTYRPPGQVHSVACDQGIAFAACGNAGLRAVKITPEISQLANYATVGFTLGVDASQGTVYAAEGGELSIWEHLGSGKLRALGRYRSTDNAVRQVVVADQYALLSVGAASLHIVDVSNPHEPTLVLKDSRLGLFYYNPIAQGLLADRYACCHWHVTGLYWYDVSSDSPRWTGHRQASRIGSRNGVAFLGDRALVTCRGGYALLSHKERRPLDEWGIHRIPDFSFHGKPTVASDRLYVSDRNSGIVVVIDISNPEQPQLVDRLELREHPGLVAVHNGTPIIPAGYQGLLIWDACGDQ
jgi:hypothetical protein